MVLLDGKVVKKSVLDSLKEKIDKLDEKLNLSVIQIGEDDASTVYVNNKRKMAEQVGIDFSHIKLDANVSQEEVLSLIDGFNRNPSVTGLMVQMPVPNHLDSKAILNAISPEKDVDGLTDYSIGKLAHGNDSLEACTARGIIELLDYYHIPIEGKNAVVVGRSDLVGKPVSNLLINRNATVTLCHSKTVNLMEYTRMADILVVAIGKPKYITKDFVKDGAVVVDVGINRDNGVLCGDVDFDDVKDKASYITPVPGGVGQMTVACLGQNVLKAYLLKKQRN